MRRILPAAIGGLAAALLSVSTATAAPAVPPADITPYAGGGTAELLAVDADIPLADLSVASVGLSPVSASVDTSATPRSTAAGANLDASLLGDLDLSDILTSATQSAPPDNAEPAEDTLIPVPAAPVLDLGVSTSRASARWPGDGVCVAPGEPIAAGFNETAGADVLTIPDLGSVVTVNNDVGGVSGTQSSLTTEEVAGELGRALVSTSETQVDAITILEGTPLQVTVGVAATPTLTATATGQPGGASVTYNDPLVTIEAPEGGLLEPLEQVGDQLDILVGDIVLGDVVDALEAITGPLSEAGLITIEVLTGEDTLQTEIADDGTGAAGAVSVAQVNVTVLEALGEDPLLDVSVDIGPMTAFAAVPAGGINCQGPPQCSDSADNDDDGFIDAEDPNCHTDGNPYNPDSYDPNDDDESGDIPECVDAVDNDDPEDELADRDDPGCYIGGDTSDPSKFDPTDDSEIDEGQARQDQDPGPLPKTGGDLPVPAALTLAGAGLAAFGLRRRLTSAP